MLSTGFKIPQKGILIGIQVSGACDCTFSGSTLLDVKVLKWRREGNWLHALENCNLWEWPLYVPFGPEQPSPGAVANTKEKQKTEREVSMKKICCERGYFRKVMPPFYIISSFFHLFRIFCNVIDQTYYLSPSFHILPPLSNHPTPCPVSFHNHSLCCLCTLGYVAFTEGAQPNRGFILQAS